MYLIGDVHGKIKEYLELIKILNDETIQLGDFGIGFIKIPKLSIQHMFIRGNHDNPKLCKKFPNFMGDFGIFDKYDLFFISGAYSVDYNLRTIGVDWWENEELTNRQIIEAMCLYEKTQPRFVISHDAPRAFLESHFSGSFNTKTSNFLEQLLGIHEPEIWVFAHHHKSIRQKFGKTHFVGLDELEMYKLEI